MDKKIILNSLIVLSFITLSFAYFVEFILQHEPCSLCKIERIPYIGSIILGSLILFINKWENNFNINSFIVYFWLVNFYLSRRY